MTITVNTLEELQAATPADFLAYIEVGNGLSVQTRRDDLTRLVELGSTLDAVIRPMLGAVYFRVVQDDDPGEPEIVNPDRIIEVPDPLPEPTFQGGEWNEATGKTASELLKMADDAEACAVRFAEQGQVTGTQSWMNAAERYRDYAGSIRAVA